MATWETTTHPLAFAHMEGGVKTVYVVPATPMFSMVTSGDRVEFDDLGYITVGTIRRYTGLEGLVEAEGHANILPEAESAEEVLEAIRSSADWDRDAEGHGVLAFRVRSARRKS